MSRSEQIVAAVIGAVILGFSGVVAALISSSSGPSYSGPSGPSSPAAPATTTPPSSGPRTPDGSGNPQASAIYRKGPLTLAYATCVDLDAPLSDRQWGEVSIGATSGGTDLCSESPAFVGTNGATIVTVNSGTDTTCQNATGWLQENSYQDLHLSVGSYVCVHTDQGRYSLLRVAAIDSTSSSITFMVKTFKKPGD